MPTARVLFVTHSGALSGAEMVLLDILPAFPNSAAFLFEEGALSESLRRIEFPVIQSRLGNGLNGFKRSSKLMKAVPLAGRIWALIIKLSIAARQFDTVYANSQKAFLLAAISAAIARRPLFWHLHDIISREHFSAAQRRIQAGFANRFANCVIAPSKAVITAFVNEGGRPELARFVPNGLDIPPATETKEQLRQKVGLTSCPLVGVFSRLAPWKGQHVVLRALAQLPGVHCIMAGTALFGEDRYASSLRALALELGVADRVLFLGQRSDVPDLMRAVDIVVHPSVDPEPFGRTIVEAMLSRTPIIASNAGAAAEILAGGEAGALIPPDNAEALREAISASFANPDGLKTRIEFAEVRARREYSVSKMQSAIARVIGEVACEIRR